MLPELPESHTLQTSGTLRNYWNYISVFMLFVRRALFIWEDYSI